MCSVLFQVSLLINVDERYWFLYRTDRLETAEGSWQDSEASIREALKKAAEAAISEQPDNEEVKNILRSTAERQLEHALSK